MNILIIGDLHFKLDNIIQCEEFISQVVQVQSSCSAIVLLGDILHYHDKIYTTVVNRFICFLEKITKPCIILVGNHDMVSNQVFCDPPGHWMNMLKKYPTVTIVDVPQYITIESIKFLACPYVYPGRLREAFDKFDVSPERVDFCLLHQEIKGCRMGVIHSTIGDDYTWSTPCFSGHIHDTQQVGNVFYVGSAFEHCFGSEQCWLTLLNPQTKNITRIKSQVTKKSSIKANLVDGLVNVPNEYIGDKTLNKCTIVADSVEEYTKWLNSEQGKEMKNKFKLCCVEKSKNKKVERINNIVDMFTQSIRRHHPDCIEIVNMLINGNLV